MNDRRMVCEMAKAFCYLSLRPGRFLRNHAPVRGVQYARTLRRRIDRPECVALCVVQITRQKTCYMRTLLLVTAQW